MDDTIDRGGFFVMPVNPFVMGRLMLESLNSRIYWTSKNLSPRI